MVEERKIYIDPRELAKTYPNVTMSTIVCCKCDHRGRKLVCLKCGHHICLSCKEPN
jgi:hypothetical protein